DGLRAIAIISVIIYHAYPRNYSSGLIGVDIFFVISGFLITDRLLNLLEFRNFSFFEFYKNRILRLFPSLIAMLILFGVLAWFYFIQPEYELFGKHLRTGSLFTNLALFSESGYFEISESQFKPLLHFWSLAVEEQ